MNYEQHSKPLRTKTPNTLSKTAHGKQMIERLFLLPTQTAQRIFNHHPVPFQINPSRNLILYHPPSSEQSRRQGFTPPQLTVYWRNLSISIPPYLNIGKVNCKCLKPPTFQTQPFASTNSNITPYNKSYIPH